MKVDALPKRALLVASATVAASSVLLPYITGYGTVLFQVVVLGAWAAVASVTSGAAADHNPFVVFSVAAFLNVILFSVPTSILFWLLRRRAPQLFVALVSAWLLLYLAALFFLFRATDGP